MPDASTVKVGFVYWGVKPQQQPGSYRGGDGDDDDPHHDGDDDHHHEISVSLVEETGVPGGNHRPPASN